MKTINLSGWGLVPFFKVPISYIVIILILPLKFGFPSSTIAIAHNSSPKLLQRATKMELCVYSILNCPKIIAVAHLSKSVDNGIVFSYYFYMDIVKGEPIRVIEHQQVLKKATDTPWNVIDEEAVVLNLDSGHYYILNETGCRIWELLDGEKTVAKIASHISQEYEVAEEVAAGDTARILGELLGEKLVEPVS